MIEYGHFIGGKHVAGKSGRTAEVFQPMDGTVRGQSRSPPRPRFALRSRTRSSAQPAWAATNPQRRARVLMKFLDLIARDNDALAEILAREHGKTIADAKGDIQRGVEVVEFALGVAPPDEGRIHRRRRPGHRHLFDAPAARRRRRHHPVQLPGDDPVVEARAGDRLRQRLHPEALRARSRACR